METFQRERESSAKMLQSWRATCFVLSRHIALAHCEHIDSESLNKSFKNFGMDAFPKERSGYPIRDFASRPETEQTFLLP